MLISARRDDHGRTIGATVTLSLTRAQTRVLLAAGPARDTARDTGGDTGGGSRRPAGAGTGTAVAGELTERLAGVARILAEGAAQAGANLAGPLHQALGELDAVIRAARTAIGPGHPGSGDPGPGG